LAGRMADEEPLDEPTGALAVASDGEQAMTAPTVVVESTMGAPGALAMTSGKELAGDALRCAEASVLLAAAYGEEPIGAATPKPGGGPMALLAVAYGTGPTGAAAPRRGKAVALLAVCCGARPTGVAALTPGEALVKEEETTGKGTQSISDRKSKVDEGGAEISANGKEASSNVTCREMMRQLDVRSRH
jgi:hypothetical protein